MQEEPYIISKKRTVRRFYPGRIIAFTLVISLITIGAVVWFARTDGKLTVNERNYGFISMGKYDNLSEASARADSVRNNGGAGYLYGEGKYEVVAACYPNKTSAAEVCERLVGAGETASVFSLSRPKISIEKPNKNADVLSVMLAKPDKIFDELYEISVKTDTKEISEAAALYAVVKLNVSVDEYAQKCSGMETEAGKYLNKLFLSLAASLSGLANVKENVAQSVKYALCEMAQKICVQTQEFVN